MVMKIIKCVKECAIAANIELTLVFDSLTAAHNAQDDENDNNHQQGTCDY